MLQNLAQKIGRGFVLGVRSNIQFRKLYSNNRYKHDIRIEILELKMQFREDLNIFLIYDP